MQYYDSSDRAFAVTILNGFFLMLIGSLALVGVAKSRSRLLLPLFVVQISEMIAVMGALCSVIFLPDKLQIFINEIKHLAGKDLRNWIMGFDETWRCVFAVAYFSIILSVNILFVRVIFQCYKYLTTQGTSPRLFFYYSFCQYSFCESHLSMLQISYYPGYLSSPIFLLFFLSIFFL